MLDNILQSTFLQLCRMSTHYTSHKLTNEVCTTTTQQLHIKKQNNNNKNTNGTYRATNPDLK